MGYGRTAIGAAGAAIVLLPLGVVLLESLAPAEASLLATLRSPTLAHYRQAWSQGDFLLAFGNTTFVALTVTALQATTAALAGYALARLRFWGRQALLLAILTTLVVPFQILVVPIFLALKWGGLINTYGALILPTAANGFSIFLMRQAFLTIPIELEEAAATAGASRLQVLWEILLPLCRPALVTVFLFTFIGEWNDLFKPLAFVTRPELRTVQLAIAQFQEQFTSSWPLLMAAVAIATIPVVLAFLLGQRQFVEGIGTTGIKD